MTEQSVVERRVGFPPRDPQKAAERARKASNVDYERWSEVVNMVGEIQQNTGWSLNKVGKMMGYAGPGLSNVMMGTNLPERTKIVRLRYMHELVKDGRADELVAMPMGRSAKRVHQLTQPATRKYAHKTKTQYEEPAKNGKSNGKATHFDTSYGDVEVLERTADRLKTYFSAELEHAPTLHRQGYKEVIAHISVIQKSISNLKGLLT
jgi:hypothetical protein